jgi:hypothetical protein
LVRQQLAQLTAKLSAVSDTAETQLPHPQAPTFMILDKKELNAQVKSMESALAVIPFTELALIASLKERIAALKLQGQATKPPGARLDSARDALGRSRARHQDAQSAVAAAQALAVTTLMDVEKMESEVALLESELATSSMEVESAPIPTDPLPGAQAHLDSLLELLKADPHVPPALVEEAGAHVAALLRGFAGSFDHAQQSRAAMDEKNTPHRLNAKHTPIQPPGTMVRLTGKQQPKRLITDYFSGNRKVMKLTA